MGNEWFAKRLKLTAPKASDLGFVISFERKFYSSIFLILNKPRRRWFVFLGEPLLKIFCVKIENFDEQLREIDKNRLANSKDEWISYWQF